MNECLTFPHGVIHRLGGPLVSAHLLTDASGSILIDTGLAGIPGELQKLGQRLGLRREALKAVLLTHGHLDHTGGLAQISTGWGAKIFAHAAEAGRIAGTAEYHGINRVGGGMEWLGRRVFRYQPSRIARALSDGDILPFWGGLRVLHLPGHTPGHCAFVSEATGLIFAGDMFASYSWSVHLPPAIFNVDGQLLRRSLSRLRETPNRGILPSHYDRMDVSLHARRLERLDR